MKDAAVGYLIARRKINEMDGSEENQCKTYNGCYRCVFSIGHSEESNVHRDNDFIGYAYACSEGARSVSEVYHELNVLTERPVTYCGTNDIVSVQYWRTGMRSSSECSQLTLPAHTMQPSLRYDC